MNQDEAKVLEGRIERYREIEKLLARAQRCLEAFGNDPSGPCGQGPFTGNTRESRKVISLRIHFSKTMGGAPEADQYLDDLNISAPEFGRDLKALLEARVASIQKEMGEI